MRTRGDKSHPVSQGYICEKSQRMDYYQNGADRLSSPMRRRADGTYEAIDWNTAIQEIAAKLAAIKSKHGGESIFYYGGGSQGNHLGATYAFSTIAALGIKYRSNALAQEKTGEAWVQGKMMATGVHGDFEHCEVAVFVGKNPWQSHGFARSRAVLNEIEKGPGARPRCHRSAPQRNGCHGGVSSLPSGREQTRGALQRSLRLSSRTICRPPNGLRHIPMVTPRLPTCFAASLYRTMRRSAASTRPCSAARLQRIARAKSVSMIEDLGVQMNVHSTLSSYLGRLVWLLTGHYARPGTNNAFVPLLGLSQSTRDRTKTKAAPKTQSADNYSRTPVTNARVIMGLIPCNVYS